METNRACKGNNYDKGMLLQHGSLVTFPVMSMETGYDWDYKNC